MKAYRNEEIVKFAREELRTIINAHILNNDDEGAKEHLKFFMEGFCWGTNIDCIFTEYGAIMLILPYQYKALQIIFYRPYFLLNFDEELKTIRKSINRHYHKIGGKF